MSNESRCDTEDPYETISFINPTNYPHCKAASDGNVPIIRKEPPILIESNTKSARVFGTPLQDFLSEDAAPSDHLQNIFTEQIHRDYPLVAFVQKVFKFSPSDIPGYSEHKRYSVPVEQFLSYGGSTGDMDFYTPLQAVFTSFTNQICPQRAGRKLSSQFVGMYTRQPDPDEKPAPDFCFSTQPTRKKQDLAVRLGYGVVAPRQMKLVYTGDRFIDLKVFDEESSSGEGEPARKKRKLTHPSFNAPAEDPDGNVPPRPLTETELQLAKYGSEMMAHGVRNHVTGWLLDETRMTLWYADRMGVVQSAPFDIFTQPHLLLLVVAAYALADPPKLGFCPLLTYPCVDAKFDDYEGVTLDLPVAQDIDGTEQTDLRFDVMAIYVAETNIGTVGRGTTIVALSATGKASELFGNGDLVAKIAWPVVDRTGEDVFIRKIRRKLGDKKPEYLNHVVDLRCSLSQSMSEVGLPRGFMTELPQPSSSEIRQFRCLVMQQYIPLNYVKDANEFKTVFLDTVRAHHWVYATSGILHRDVSPGNIMFYREAGNGAVRGVLCDWDLALDEAESSGPHAEGVVHHPRTGTAPFMALDLLAHGDPPAHRSRFDLESFFFLLVSHCAVYNPETQTYGYIPGWASKSPLLIGDCKRRFLADYKVRNQVFSRVHSQYLPIVDSWVKPLLRLFHPVNVTDWYAWRHLISGHADAQMDGDLGLQERLEHEAAACAKKRDEAITYERFMACLGQYVSEDL